MHLLLLFCGALLLSSLLTHYVRNAALRRKWACGSIRKRDVHGSPIPRAGGIAICGTFILVVVPYIVGMRLAGYRFDFGLYTTFAVLAPACLMFVLGLLDDLRNIPPKIKFGVQIVAGLLLYYGGVRIWFFPIVTGYKELSGIVSVVLTVFWVLLISNAFNLIDGLDGLSAGSALFSTLVVFVVSLLNGTSFVTIVTAVLAGAILGFLRYNFNPATIFLGDSGSLFLGFMLSAVSLVGSAKGTTVVAVAIPIVAFGLPLLDTVLSVARRYLSGQPLFRADREHIHHRLLKRGFSHKQAVVVLYVVSALFGLISLLMLYPSGKSVGIVLTVVGIGGVIGVQHLRYPAFAEIGRVAKRTVDQRQIIVNNLAIRRATEELSDADDFQAICEVLNTAFRENEFDGFELVLRPHITRYGQVPAELRPGFDGRYRYEWRKTAIPANASATWQLSLSLRGPISGQDAALTVFRHRADKNLLFDVNMLTGEFQAVLSSALERAFEYRPEAPVVLPSVDIASAGLATMSD